MAQYGSGLYGAGLYGVTAVLTATELDVYPPRVNLAASGLAEGSTVTIYRTLPGSTVRTPVRGAEDRDITSDGIIVQDAEAPFGVLLTYTLEADGIDVGTDTITLDIGMNGVALSDAISGNAAEVRIIAWPDKTTSRQNSVFAVGGRNVVVVGERGQSSSTLEVFTETEESRLNLIDLLTNATSGIIQLRAGRADGKVYYGVDGYYAVLSDTETRWSQDGSDERRRFSLDVAEVDGWAAALDVSEFTYQDVADAYDGLTYNDLAGDYATYLDMGQGDFQ
jgi:hypothetical protein